MPSPSCWPRRRQLRCAVTVFPELCLTGYTCGDLFQQSSLQQAAFDALRELLIYTSQRYSGIVIVGLPWAIEDCLFNVAAVVHRGVLLGLVPKSYLPNYKEFYERRWFAAASKLAADRSAVRGQVHSRWY